MYFAIFLLLFLRTSYGLDPRPTRIIKLYNSPISQPSTRPVLPPSVRVPQTVCTNNSTNKVKIIN